MTESAADLADQAVRLRSMLEGFEVGSVEGPAAVVDAGAGPGEAGDDGTTGHDEASAPEGAGAAVPEDD